MFKKTIKIIIVSLSLLAVIGCDKINELTQSSLEDVLNNYLNASLIMNSEEAYKYVSTADREAKSLSEFKSENDKRNQPFLAMLISNVSYKVLKVTKSEDTAKADVEITVPDFASMMKDMMGSAFAAALGGKKKDALAVALAKKYENADVPTTTINKEFNMIKEESGWRVFLDWKAEKEKKEKHEKELKIIRLQTDAIKLEIAGQEDKSTVKMLEAIKIYEKILKIDPENSKVQKDYNALKERVELIKKQGFWTVNIETNPIDDSKTVTLSMNADSGKSKWGKKVYFIARCKSNSTDVYIGWGSYLGREASVLTRVGENKAVTSSWLISTDKKATFHKKPVSFLKKMSQSNKLVAQITPYNENPITAIFDTTGLKNALLPLRETCGW